MFPRNSRTVAAAVAAALLSGLVSCLPLVTPDLLSQVADETSPVVTILSPADGDSYAAVVLVEGSVSDASGAEGTAGLATSVSYEVLSTSISGETSVSEDGSFSFSFETTGLSGSITIRIVASDWNANTTEVFLGLVNDGAIPSFSVEPGNASVTLEWDDVPLANSYTLRYTGTGQIPSETTGIALTGVSSPLTVAGLTNGGEYSFLLEAVHDNTSSWSDVLSAIPVSPFTLLPTVVEDYGKLTVRWNAIPGSARFDVLKSTDPAGPFTPVVNGWESHEFVDLNVDAGTRYFYSVRAAHEHTLDSGLESGQPSRFPEAMFDLLGTKIGVFTEGWSVATSGNILLLGRYGGLFIGIGYIYAYDITNPANPVELDYIQVSGNTGDGDPPQSIAIANSTAVVATDEAEIQVLDISDPANLSNTPLGGFTNTQEVAIEGGFAYVADSGSGVRKVDLSSPAIVGTYTTAADATGIAVTGGFAYAAVGSSGLEIIDVSDMSLAAGPHSVGGTAVSVEVVGTLAYVTLAEGGVQIVDVSSFGSLTNLGSISTPGPSVSITIDGDRAYLSDVDLVDPVYSALHILNISDPSAPTIIRSEEGFENPYEVLIRADTMYLASRSVFDLATYRINPIPDLNSPTSVFPGANPIFDLDHRYALSTGSGGSNELAIYDRDTQSIVHTAVLSAGYDIASARITGDYAVYALFDTVALEGGKVGLIDLAGESGIESAGEVDIDGIAYSIEVHGDYAYVSSFNLVYVVDISNPDAPAVAGIASLPGFAVSLTKEGDYLYAVTTEFSSPNYYLRVVDVSIPERPEQVASLDVVAEPSWVGVSGSYAFVGVRSAGTAALRVINISNPQSPSDVAQLDLVSDVEYGAIQASYLYVAAGTTVYVIDIADPAVPVIVGTEPAAVGSPMHIWGDSAIMTVSGVPTEYSLVAP